MPRQPPVIVVLLLGLADIARDIALDAAALALLPFLLGAEAAERAIDRRPWPAPPPEPGNLSAEARAELAAMEATIKYATADAEWCREDRPRDWVGEKRAEEVIAWALDRIREIRGGLPIAPGVATSAKPAPGVAVGDKFTHQHIVGAFEVTGSTNTGWRLTSGSLHVFDTTRGLLDPAGPWRRFVCAHPWDERYMVSGHAYCGARNCGVRLEVGS